MSAIEKLLWLELEQLPDGENPYEHLCGLVLPTGSIELDLMLFRTIMRLVIDFYTNYY